MPQAEGVGVRRTCCSGRSGGRRSGRCRKRSVPAAAHGPIRTTCLLFQPGEGPQDAQRGCRWPDASPARSAKNSSVASANGLPASMARANCPMPCIAHQIAGLIAEQGVAARQVDGAVGALGVGRVVAVNAPIGRRRGPPAADRAHQFLQCGDGDGPQKRPQGRQLARSQTIRSGRRTAARGGPAAAGGPSRCNYPVRRWPARRRWNEPMARSFFSRPGNGCRQASKS